MHQARLAALESVEEYLDPTPDCGRCAALSGANIRGPVGAVRVVLRTND